MEDNVMAGDSPPNRFAVFVVAVYVRESCPRSLELRSAWLEIH
jgi:hypothetical protein